MHRASGGCEAVGAWLGAFEVVDELPAHEEANWRQKSGRVTSRATQQ